MDGTSKGREGNNANPAGIRASASQRLPPLVTGGAWMGELAANENIFASNSDSCGHWSGDGARRHARSILSRHVESATAAVDGEVRIQWYMKAGSEQVAEQAEWTASRESPDSRGARSWRRGRVAQP